MKSWSIGVCLALGAGFVAASIAADVQDASDRSPGATPNAPFAGEKWTAKGQGPPGRWAALTDEQRAALDDLRARRGAGELSPEQFRAEVRAILGNGPLHRKGGPRGLVVERLGLTEEQRAAAAEVFRDAREDIATLRETARQEVRALLTEEQQALFGDMRPRFSEHRRAGQDGRHGGHHVGQAEGRAFHGRHGQHGALAGRHPGHAGRFADALGLTDEQRQAVRTVFENLRVEAWARRVVARDAFRSILTEEQRQTLDSLRSGFDRFEDVPAPPD